MPARTDDLVIKVGDFYLNCSYHPVYCTKASGRGYNAEAEGISLFTGALTDCSLMHCCAGKLNAEQVAIKIKNRDRWLAAEAAFRKDWDASHYNDLFAEEEKELEAKG